MMVKRALTNDRLEGQTAMENVASDLPRKMAALYEKVWMVSDLCSVGN